MTELVRGRHSRRSDSSEALFANLPDADTTHWFPRQKAAVVAAVSNGMLTLPEACERYRLTEEEFYSWIEAIDHHGIAGLRMTTRTEQRSVERHAISEAGVAMLHGNDGVNCLITDISDQGARLEFETPTSPPTTFELRCAKSGRSWWVNAVWNRAEVIGVRFSNPLPPPWIIKSGLGAWLLGSRRTVSIDRFDLQKQS
jgi:hypothetical protein